MEALTPSTLLAQTRRCLRVETLDRSADSLGILGLKPEAWYQNCASLVSGPGKLHVALRAHDEIYVLSEGNGTLKVSNLTSGEEWVVLESCAISHASMVESDGSIIVWVGELTGKLLCFALDLVGNNVFHPLGSADINGPVAFVRPLAWQFPSTRVFCWVVSSKSVHLCGLESAIKLRSLLEFTLPPNLKGNHIVRAEMVESTYGPETVFAAHFSPAGTSVATIAIDSRAACMLAEQLLVQSQPAMQLQAHIGANGELCAGQTAIGVFVLPGSVTVPASPTYDWSRPRDVFSAPIGLAVMACPKAGDVHIFVVRTPQDAVLTALRLVDLAAADLSQHSVVAAAAFDHLVYNPIEKKIARQVSSRSQEAAAAAVPVWTIVADMTLSLPSRKQALVRAVNCVSDMTLHEREREFAVKMILLEALLAFGEAGHVSRCIRRATQEQDLHIQRFFDWAARDGDSGADTSALQINSLVTDLKGALSALLVSFVIPHLLSRHESGQSVQLRAVGKALDDVMALLVAVETITRSFCDRKIEETLGPSDIVAFEAILQDGLVHRSLVDIFLLHEKVVLLKCCLALVATLTHELSTGLLPFGPGTGPQGTSVMQQRHRALCSAVQVSCLPDSLRIDPLGALLVQALPARFQPLADLSSPLFSTDVVVALKDLLLLPFHLFEDCQRSILQQKLYAGNSLGDVRRLLHRAILPGRLVLLYHLFDCILVQQAGQLEAGLGAEGLFARFAEALRCSTAEVEAIWAVHRVDVCEEPVESQVRTLAQRGMHSLMDSWGIGIVPRIARRLLCLGKNDDANVFMMFLAAVGHPYLHTVEGVLAFGAALPQNKNWELVWMRARSLCDELPLSEGLEARHLLTSFMCQWCLQHKWLGQFLQHDLSPLEVETVLAFLYERVDEDIEKSIFPSAYTDLLVGYLLQLHRLAEAKEVHETVVPQDSSVMMSDEAHKAQMDRGLLIAAHKRLLVVPEINYEILRHLQDV